VKGEGNSEKMIERARERSDRKRSEGEGSETERRKKER
jgi:hypothetical protein